MEGLAHARTAERLDPLSPATGATVGWVLYYSRRYDDAMVQLEQVVAREPQFATARIALGRALLMAGLPDRAIAELERAVQDAGHASSTVALLAHALGCAGRLDEARTLAAELEVTAASRYVSGYYLALPYLGAGDTARALDHLEAAVRERAAQLIYIGTEPVVDVLRDEPRFRAIIDALQFPAA